MASTIAYLFGRSRPRRHERIPGVPQDEVDVEEGAAGGETSAPAQAEGGTPRRADGAPPVNGTDGTAETTTEEGNGAPQTTAVPDLDGDGERTNNPGSPNPADPGSISSDADAAAPSDPEHERIRRYMTARRLAELEEERELRRRRHSTCTLIVVFLLFRLWVQALADGDVGLLLLSLVGTSWTARWVQTRRESEDEIDRAIEEYVRQADAEVASGGTGRTLTASARARASAIEAADLRLMSFQAQLALAILESQRQMMENGGYGRPEGDQMAGLDDEARERWTRYSYQHDEEKPGQAPSASPPPPGSGLRLGGRVKMTRGGYGSVSSIDEEGQQLRPENDPSCSSLPSTSPSSLPSSGLYDLSLEVKQAGSDGNDDGSLGQPSCSICLCEYEEGEGVARLPCGHTYHDDCVTAWVANHVRCPLCNFDLREEHPSELSSRSASTVEDSIV